MQPFFEQVYCEDVGLITRFGRKTVSELYLYVKMVLVLCSCFGVTFFLYTKARLFVVKSGDSLTFSADTATITTTTMQLQITTQNTRKSRMAALASSNSYAFIVLFACICNSTEHVKPCTNYFFNINLVYYAQNKQISNFL